MKGADPAQHDLARHLRGLVDRSNRTLRAIGAHCGCSDTTISKYLNGENLPRWEFVVQLVEVCSPPESRRDRLRAVQALWHRAATPSVRRPQSEPPLADAQTRLLQAKDEIILAQRQLLDVTDELSTARRQLYESAQVEYRSSALIMYLRLVLAELSALITRLTADRDRCRQQLMTAEHERDRAQAQLSQAKEEQRRATAVSESAQARIAELEDRLRHLTTSPAPHDDRLPDVVVPDPDRLLLDAATSLDQVQQVLDDQERNLIELEDELKSGAEGSDLDRLTAHLNSVLHHRLDAHLCRLGLDALSVVVEGLGIDAGNHVVRTVEKRLLAQFANERVTVAHLHNDEFVVLIEDAATDVIETIQRIQDALSEPAYYGGHGVAMSPCIGLVGLPTDIRTAADVLRASASTMKRARRNGHRQWSLYDPMFDQQEQREARLAAVMPGALELGEISIVYDDIGTHGGFNDVYPELRWDHPDGVIRHLDCVSLAERTGFMLPLGEWMIQQATSHAGAHGCALDMDLPRSLAYSPDLVSVIRAALDDAGLAASRLRLGFGMYLLSDEGSTAHHNAKALRDLGCRILTYTPDSDFND